MEDQNSHAGHGHPDDAALAELLDLDAAVLGAYLDEVPSWMGRWTPESTRTVVDLGAGTGRGSLALADRFPAAEVVAVDRSASMLERTLAAARRHGLDGRVRGVEADVDAGWPALGAVDVVWASSSLHEVADPARVLGNVRAALRPGGVLVVVEMDGPPSFLPDDVRPGLERRVHEALLGAGRYAHPDWAPHLHRTGFEVLGRRRFSLEGRLTGRQAEHYLRASLAFVRPAVADRLAPEDLAALDALMTTHSLSGLTVRGSRTAVAARPATDSFSLGGAR